MKLKSGFSIKVEKQFNEDGSEIIENRWYYLTSPIKATVVLRKDQMEYLKEYLFNNPLN